MLRRYSSKTLQVVRNRSSTGIFQWSETLNSADIPLAIYHYGASHICVRMTGIKRSVDDSSGYYLDNRIE